MTKCPQCGAAVNPAQRFCGECGTRLQQGSTPASTTDRNAVPHRPGGGKPDPWEVGAAGQPGEFEDDFFSRYRPKSAVDDAGETPTPARPRRSRRRFEPDLNDGSAPQNPPVAPPVFPPQAGEPKPNQAEPRTVPPTTPAPAEPRRSPFAGRDDAERAAEDRARQEQEQRARQEKAERERRAATERARQVQALQEQQNARDQRGTSQDASQPLPWLPAVNVDAQAKEPQGPGSQPSQSDRPKSASEPNDATFTQLIRGLDNDPADKPILADGLDKTGIVPLPPRQDDAAAQPKQSEAERNAQQRAAEFYGKSAAAPAGPTNEQSMPALPTLSQDAVKPEPEARDRRESPFSSPFVSPATTPQTARRPEPVAEEPVEEGFWPFGDELDDEPTATSQQSVAPNLATQRAAAEQNRYQSGAGSAAAGGVTAPGLDFGPGGGAGSGSGGGPGGRGSGPDDAEQKRKGLRLILIAAVAAVVIIIGAFAISGLFRGNDEAPVADETQQQEEQETGEQPADPAPAEETPSESAETETPASFEPVAFQSGSGNLRCQITPENGVACQILQQNFSTPDEACTSGGGAGVAVGVNDEGITWPCLTSNLGGGEVLAYDQPITAGDYTCSINFTTGVTCENASGASFSLEFNSGVDTNGDTAAEPQIEVEPLG